MSTYLNRRTFLAATGLAGLALAAGCSGNGSGSSTASSSSSVASGKSGSRALTVGTLATEDLLPLWVAKSEGIFEQTGQNVDIVQFQSATELIAGMASGDVDMAMTDIMVTAGMFASGIDVKMEWVTLGETADQGRFGIMVGPQSSVTSLTDLAGVPIGVGSNTILEYVMDKLMEAAGVPADKIVVEELQKLPVRYQTMLSGDVAAAALPGTLLALGEANGCKLIADDTQGENLSQSVMISRSSFGLDSESSKQLEQLEETWNKAVDMVNANPEAYRTVLVESANLPAEIADTYPISKYPSAKLPTAAMVNPVLDWMQGKNYLTQSLAYDETTGTFSVK